MITILSTFREGYQEHGLHIAPKLQMHITAHMQNKGGLTTLCTSLTYTTTTKHKMSDNKGEMAAPR